MKVAIFPYPALNKCIPPEPFAVQEPRRIAGGEIIFIHIEPVFPFPAIVVCTAQQELQVLFP